MAEASSMSERAAIVVLAANGGRLSARNLHAIHGVLLKKPSRERLTRAGLIISQREGRSFALELTDDGWAFADEAIAKDPPVGRATGPGGRALFALLTALGARGVKLSTVLRERPVSAPPTPATSPVPAITPAPSTPLAAVEDRVAGAYQHLAKERRDWVALTALRRSLADVDRSTLDGTIKQMLRDKKLILTLEDDQSRLTKADRDAALRIGSDNMHYLSMG